MGTSREQAFLPSVSRPDVRSSRYEACPCVCRVAELFVFSTDFEDILVIETPVAAILSMIRRSVQKKVASRRDKMQEGVWQWQFPRRPCVCFGCERPNLDTRQSLGLPLRRGVISTGRCFRDDIVSIGWLALHPQPTYNIVL